MDGWSYREHTEIRIEMDGSNLLLSLQQSEWHNGLSHRKCTDMMDAITIGSRSEKFAVQAP
jgi:hypothetical protein